MVKAMLELQRQQRDIRVSRYQITQPESSAKEADLAMVPVPTFSLCKGNGAIKGMGARFTANSVKSKGLMSLLISLRLGHDESYP
jgi:hypothetical protein